MSLPPSLTGKSLGGHPPTLRKCTLSLAPSWALKSSRGQHNERGVEDADDYVLLLRDSAVHRVLPVPAWNLGLPLIGIEYPRALPIDMG